MFPYSLVRTQCLSLLLAAAQLIVVADDDASKRQYFESKVRPLLSEHCYECHSGDADRVEGGLRLDSAAAVAHGGDSGPLFESRDPASSLLIEAIRYEGLEMPPSGKLDDAEISILERWIADGAYWPPDTSSADVVPDEFDLQQRIDSHWVWQPPTRQKPPAARDAASAIDALLAEAQREADTPASSRVDRRTLARRISFDLLGLPPSPEAVDRLVADTRPDAVQRFIDRLLADPGLGPRWGRHWLDLIRFAESRGHEFDHDIPGAFHYRDYVIRALNIDLPYDQFLIEHLAGDLIDPPRTHPLTGGNESVLGTGFWHLGEWVHSPVDMIKDEADRFDNAIDVFSKTFLGLTVACARCHDHKFDAISTRDYYALGGFLQSSDYRLVRFDADATNRRVAERLARIDRNGQREIKQFLSAAFIDALPRLADALTELATAGPEAKDSLSDRDWAACYSAASENPSSVLFPVTQSAQRRPAGAAARANRIVEFQTLSAERFFQNGYSFGQRPVHSGDLVWTDDPANPIRDVAATAFVRRDPAWKQLENIRPPRTNFKNKLDEAARAGKVYRTRTFTINSARLAYRLRGAGRVFLCVGSHRLVFGPLHGNTVVDFETGAEPEWITHDVARYQGQRGHLEFEPRGDSELEIFEISHDVIPPPSRGEMKEVDPRGAVTSFIDTLHDALLWWQAGKGAKTAPATAEHYGRHLAWLWENRDLLLGPETTNRVRELATRIVIDRQTLQSEIVTHSRVAPALMDGSAETQPLYIRGNSSRPAERIPRRSLQAFGAEPIPPEEPGSGRVRLAQQLVDADNRLVDRVAVNRVWHHLFGTGLVPTPDDFGVLGQPPTQQHVLDLLALEFRRQGRSLKRTMRELLRTDVYARSSIAHPEALRRDPNNTAWHYRPVRRLEGEALRDTLLYLAGNLNRAASGPSVPVHLTSFMDGRGRPPQSGPADGNGRRSIFLEVRRNFLSPMMLAFDTPSPFSSMGRRNRSNVPAQALIMQNNPFVSQQTKDWANRSADGNPAAKHRIETLYQQAFGRPPTMEELRVAREFVAEGSPQAWHALAHVLVNVKEFMFIY